MQYLFLLLRKILQQCHLPENQCRLSAGRGTIADSQVTEVLQVEYGATPRSINDFVDLMKAFDIVTKEGLWKIMMK